MKKLFALLVCTIMLVNVLLPVSAEGIACTVRDRLASGEYVTVPEARTVNEDDPDAEIVYIDVSPEEWKETFMNDPAFINRSDKTIFLFRDTISPRAICYNCGKASMTLKGKWEIGWHMDPINCPGASDGMSIDNMVANIYTYCDYCTICGPLTEWAYNPDRKTWDWYVECTDNSSLVDDNIYKVYIGKSTKDGYGEHNCVDIYDHNIIHGRNCSCH